jgi:ribosomal protein L37AE/L43A
MNIEETYNIHKKINCVFPFFKSKLLCKKGIHNYQLKRKQKETIWQCRCCKAETKFEGGNTNE